MRSGGSRNRWPGTATRSSTTSSGRFNNSSDRGRSLMNFRRCTHIHGPINGCHELARTITHGCPESNTHGSATILNLQYTYVLFDRRGVRSCHQTVSRHS